MLGDNIGVKECQNQGNLSAIFHPASRRIIYGLRNIPLIGDAYEIGESPHDHGKRAFNVGSMRRTDLALL